MADNIQTITFGNSTSLASGTLVIDFTTDTAGGSVTAAGQTFNIPTGTPLVDIGNGAFTVSTPDILGTGATVTLSSNPASVGVSASVLGTQLVNTTVPTNLPIVCFASGTQIRTARGDIAVEDLEIGDFALTVSGDLRPVTWVGSRTMMPSDHAQPWNVHPVRVRAGAFGTGLPERELRLSPGHPVLVGADEDGEGGHLVPIMCLINGTTIERVPVDEVTYWHVELDQHDVLFAEGLPAESYLDWGDREFFSEAEAHAIANPDFVLPGLAARCRPVAIDGAVVENERARLEMLFATELSMPCGWPQDDVLVANC